MGDKKKVLMGAPLIVNSGLEIVVVGDLFIDDMEAVRTPMDIMTNIIEMALDSPTIRLSINTDGSINAMAWPENRDMFRDCEATYQSADKLPDWVQSKLAVLMLLDPDEPNKREVAGVGRRINHTIFWVYPDGVNTREESKDQGT